MSKYKPTIGLEIHAELLTDSKLFCGCKNSPNSAEPNSHICPVCMGYPGALPYINKKAIEQMLRVGCALEGEFADFTEFDRKHYFYPDIPKGYQISQFAYPIISKALLNDIQVERIHLEEDTAKSVHNQHEGATLIDFNRSGVPLMELVTKPVIHDAETATDFAEMLQLILRYLKASNARMEWGEMRVEANISVSDSDELGCKVEVKNLNSFKAVRESITYEIKRQSEALDKGEKIIQETRGWDDNKGKTFSQRLKESAEEYRYMPEPDLPKIYLSQEKDWSFDIIKSQLPELPNSKIKKYISKGVSEEQSRVLIKDIELSFLFDSAISKAKSDKQVKLIANYVTSDLVGYLETKRKEVFENVKPEFLSELSELIDEGEISSRGAKDILEMMVREGGSPKSIAEKNNLYQQSDEGVLESLAKNIISQNEKVAGEYREGKEQALQFLVGKIMKETKGSANPKKVQDILKKLI